MGWFSEKIRALRRSAKVEKTADWIKGWPDVTSLAPETAQQVEELRSELKHHLARLMPDEFTEDMDVAADHPDILTRLEKLQDSWNWRYHRYGIRSPPAPSHRIKTLLDGLLRSHEVRLPGTRSGSEGGHLPLTVEEATVTRGYFTEACKRLRTAIEDENSSALFACGGSIPVVDRGQAAAGDKTATTTTTSPVQLYWSTVRSDSTARKLVLPLDGLAPQSSAAALDDLVAACQPASFGRNGEEILDPSYRLAGKIDPANFASSFHPADFGILQMVENVLLPGIGEKDLGYEDDGSTKVMSKSARHYRKLHAELYKLNVCSLDVYCLNSQVCTQKSLTRKMMIGVLRPIGPFRHTCRHPPLRESGRLLGGLSALAVLRGSTDGAARGPAECLRLERVQSIRHPVGRVLQRLRARNRDYHRGPSVDADVQSVHHPGPHGKDRRIQPGPSASVFPVV